MAMAIRDLKTGMFYAHGKWTTDLRLADRFLDLTSVHGFLQDQKLQSVDAIILSDDGTRVCFGISLTGTPQPKEL